MNADFRPGLRRRVLSGLFLAVPLAPWLIGCGRPEATPSSPPAAGAKKDAGGSAAAVPWPKNFNPPVDIRTEPVKVPEQIRGPSPPIEGARKP